MFFGNLGVVLWALIVPASAQSKPPRFRQAPRTELPDTCDRKNSSVMRRGFVAEARQRSGLPPNERRELAVTWPEGCPLNPLVDMWGRHEQLKSRKKNSGGGSKPGAQEWLVNLSGSRERTFKSEHYADLHLATYYMSETPAQGVGVCLADYCDSFEFCNKKPELSWGEALSSEAPPCDDELYALWAGKCRHLVDLCWVPDEANVSSYNITLQAKLLLHTKWCESMTCPYQTERFFSERRQLFAVLIFVGIFGLGFLILYCCSANMEEPKPRRLDRRFDDRHMKKFN